MRNTTNWVIENVTLARVAPLIVASAAIAFATPAHAVGTAAGTTISNTATATFDDPTGNPTSVPSNTVDIKVDELLDVTVVSNNPTDVLVRPGTTAQVLSFTVTNSGNGSEAFSLTPNGTIGGDQFDPTTTQIVIDSNNNGVYDAGTDTVYNPGANDPVLAPDASVRVFVLSTIPTTAVDTNRGLVDLTARAVTGTGAPGTVFAGAGQGGSDAMVGATGADSDARGAYQVQDATVNLTKSAAIVDPFGGTKSVPGAVITYTLVATITGTGTLNNVAIGDVIPAGTAYQAETTTLQGAALTDATDGDAGSFSGTAVSVRLGSVTGGQTRTVTFKVKIN